MEESRRFLRLVMPGFVFGLEVILCLFIVFPDWTTTQLSALTGKDGLGVILGSIFASGALGYIFATVHHFCHWSIDEDILNHVPLIERLIQKGLIPKEAEVDREKALIVSMALWYERAGEGRSIDIVADKKLVSLGDITHGLGTARIASVFAFVTVLGFCVDLGTIHCEWESVIRTILMLLITIGMIVLFWNGYSRAGRLAQGIYDTILESALTEERIAKK